MTEHTYHPDAPVDADGYPIHPERGHRICGRAKSDRTTPNGMEAGYPFCCLASGHGCEEDRGPGQACSHHGGDAGPPEGPRNPNWRSGLYSENFGEPEADRAEHWIDFASGDRLLVEDFVRMGEKALLYEFVRIERAIALAPDPDLSQKWACIYCGHGLPSNQIYVCPACEQTLDPDETVVRTAHWVDMHDRAISERIERWFGMLETYKNIVEGTDINVNVGVTFEDAIYRAEQLISADGPEERAEIVAGAAP